MIKVVNIINRNKKINEIVLIIEPNLDNNKLFEYIDKIYLNKIQYADYNRNIMEYIRYK